MGATLPAICAVLAELRPDARGTALLEVPGDGDVLEVTDDPDEALRDVPQVASGSGLYAWLAGEASMVRGAGGLDDQPAKCAFSITPCTPTVRSTTCETRKSAAAER